MTLIRRLESILVVLYIFVSPRVTVYKFPSKTIEVTPEEVVYPFRTMSGKSTVSRRLVVLKSL